MKKVLLFILAVVLFTSCYTNWVTIGNYDELKKQGMEEYQYEKDKQFYLLDGLIPLGHSRPEIPNGPCEIKTKTKFVDYLVEFATLGVLSMRTAEVYALRPATSVPAEYSAPVAEEKVKKEKAQKEPKQETVKAEKVEKEKKVSEPKEPKPEKVVEPKAEKASKVEKEKAAETAKAEKAPRVEKEKTAEPVKAEKAPKAEKTAKADKTESPKSETVVEQSVPQVPQIDIKSFKVGDKIMYKIREQWRPATIISLLPGDKAKIETEEGLQLERFLKDLQKIE